MSARGRQTCGSGLGLTRRPRGPQPAFPAPRGYCKALQIANLTCIFRPFAQFLPEFGKRDYVFLRADRYQIVIAEADGSSATAAGIPESRKADKATDGMTVLAGGRFVRASETEGEVVMAEGRNHAFVLGYLGSHDSVDVAELSGLLGISFQSVKAELCSVGREASVGGEPCLAEVAPNRFEVTDRERLSLYIDNRVGERELGPDDGIALLLALTRTFKTQQQLADALFMSRSSVEKRLARLVRDQILPIEAVRRRGVRFAGDESQRRRVIVGVLMPFVSGPDWEESVRRFDGRHFPLLGSFSAQDVHLAADFVRALPEAGEVTYADESLANLFCYLLAVLWGLSSGGGTIADDEVPDQPEGVVGETDRRACAGVVAELDERLGLGLPGPECDALVTLMLSLRRTRTSGATQIIERMGPLVGRILASIRERYSIDLTGDRLLVEGLSLHVFATVIRGVSMVSSPSLYPAEELKRAYPLGFELATVAAEQIERDYDYLPSDVEIVYIALHLQAALERMGQGVRATSEVRALIVCHYGLAASNLIAERICQALPQLRVVGCQSLNEYLAHGSVDADIIVSTEPLPKSPLPVFYVTPMLRKPELESIRGYLHGKRYLNSSIAVLVYEADVVDLSGCAGPTQTIRALAEPLRSRGLVADGFVESVLTRERVSPTSLSRIALPHGDPSLVNKTHLVVGLAPSGIEWEGSHVTVALLLAFSPDSLRRDSSLFSTFYRRLAAPETEVRIGEACALAQDAFRHRLASLVASD